MDSFPHKRVIFWTIIVALIIVIIYLIKSSFVTTQKLPEQIITPTPTIVTTFNQCSSFTADKGEVTCEEAKEVALKKYPGKLLSVNKAVRHYEAGPGPETQTKEARVWIFNIRPDDQSIFPPTPKPEKNVRFLTTDTIGVIVNRLTKEILFFEPIYPK